MASDMKKIVISCPNGCDVLKIGTKDLAGKLNFMTCDTCGNKMIELVMKK